MDTIVVKVLEFSQASVGPLACLLFWRLRRIERDTHKLFRKFDALAEKAVALDVVEALAAASSATATAAANETARTAARRYTDPVVKIIKKLINGGEIDALTLRVDKLAATVSSMGPNGDSGQ